MSSADLLRPAGLFDALSPEPADALLALIGLHAADPRRNKIDLGVGVFRDDRGDTPVMRAVKLAESELLETELSKSYLGAEGDVRFIELLTPILFGDAAAADGWRGVQTPGGTGALRLATELVARSNPAARVWVGSPTWPNHAPIAAAAGLSPRQHAFFDAAKGVIDFDAMLSALRSVARGDIVLLHGCCHNPTGADLTADQWAAVAKLLAERGVTPLVDLAYQGLGDGLDPDAAGMRHLVASVPEAMIAYSCDKNFGLYRERVGGLWVKGATEAATGLAFGKMLTLARSLWSMPPSHGAAIVRTILADKKLEVIWRSELDAMRVRINRLRGSLAKTHPRLEPLGHQRGMFATLPIRPDDIVTLREAQGIYMAGSGRINIAGLREAAIPHFVKAIAPFLA